MKRKHLNADNATNRPGQDAVPKWQARRSRKREINQISTTVRRKRKQGSDKMLWERSWSRGFNMQLGAHKRRITLLPLKLDMRVFIEWRNFSKARIFLSVYLQQCAQHFSRILKKWKAWEFLTAPLQNKTNSSNFKQANNKSSNTQGSTRLHVCTFEFCILFHVLIVYVWMWMC